MPRSSLSPGHPVQALLAITVSRFRNVWHDGAGISRSKVGIFSYFLVCWEAGSGTKTNMNYPDSRIQIILPHHNHSTNSQFLLTNAYSYILNRLNEEYYEVLPPTTTSKSFLQMFSTIATFGRFQGRAREPQEEVWFQGAGQRWPWGPKDHVEERQARLFQGKKEAAQCKGKTNW